jgi:hypothetical protein
MSQSRREDVEKLLYMLMNMAGGGTSIDSLRLVFDAQVKLNGWRQRWSAF